MKRRRVIRTAFMLLSLSVALWRLPTMIESIVGKTGGADSEEARALASLNAAAGPSRAVSRGPTVFAAGGAELSDEERNAMLRRARALAPAPLEPADRATRSSPDRARMKDTADQAQREIRRLLEQKPPR